MNYPIVITTVLGLFLSAMTCLAEGQRDQLESQIAALQASIASNQQKIDQIDKAIEALSANRLTSRAKDLPQNRAQIDAYLKQKQQLIKMNNDLQKRLDECRRQLASLK